MRRFPSPLVYISNAAWHYGLPTNRQQLPKRLARHARVLYSSPFSISQALLGKVKFQHYKFGLREACPNLFLFHSIRLLPMVRAQVWPLTWVDHSLQIRFLKHYMDNLGFKQPILWGYFPPSFGHLIGQLGEVLTCYHCTDDHAGHAQAKGLEPEPIREAERRLLQEVDVVFTTSRPLYEEKKEHNPNTYLMPNVADVEHFFPVSQDAVSVASEFRDLSGPVVGFVGAVDAYKVDLSLIEEVSARLPNWTFVFVGPIGSGDMTRRSDLPQAANLHFLGRRPYARLPNYVAGFDVCIIPYNLNCYTSGVFPLKFWEYLASGKPVVTTPLPALRKYYDYVEVADDPDTFVSALKKAYTTVENEDAREERVGLASGQSWDRRAEEMLDVLHAHL